jgi:peptidyl-tRNA hydrolase, PTH1 family
MQRLKALFRRGTRVEVPAPSALVVGLGNPGSKYADTRHNIGFRVVQCLAARHAGDWQADRALQSMLCRAEIAGKSVALLAPQTFMNRSGESVVAALDRWTGLEPSSDVIVVYDDLDLPTGRIRLRPSGGGGGHNGIGDILDRLETRDIPRLRFGIGHPGSSQGVVDWVLTAFADEEEEEILPSAVEWAADALEAAIGQGVHAAMGRFNAARPDGS